MASTAGIASDRASSSDPDRAANKKSERASWRNFFVAMGALGLALALALYSGAAAQTGHLAVAAGSALTALALAGWVGLTIVPKLARRTPLRWLAYQIDYKLTREGIVYLGGVGVVTLAALNTGNNLLFMVLACLLSGILISGVLSRVVLSGVDLHLELPEHIFAKQPAVALAELRNEKFWLPSFSLSVVGEAPESKRQHARAAAAILTRPVYFPYLPRRGSVRQSVELTFPRRGMYRQDALGLRTKFPFGFLQKTRRMDANLEIVAYPAVKPSDEFYDVLPLVTGELESYVRGRGHDLYAIRDYRSTDSARHVDWKATAKKASLQVREFAREDERRVLLALDPEIDPAAFKNVQDMNARFDRAVDLCASLAWHFYELDSVLEFRTAGTTIPAAPAAEIIYDALRSLALAEPRPRSAAPRFLDQLTEQPDIFKIIVTFEPRGGVPTRLWTSSYLLFQS
ncbi:MAG: DUF58 domain-containing protein [Candidatus Acidiferrales bacterium]|jgi:uncharacterized protein (DUF58 family)